MTIADSRPDLPPAALCARQSPEADCLAAPAAARLRLEEMRRDFSAPTFAAILTAFHGDLTAVAAGLRASSGEALARHGHVLTALAGELGELALSERGRRIELERDPGFALETAALIAPLIALLEQEGAA